LPHLADAVTFIFVATLSVSAGRQLFSLTIAAPVDPLKSGAELRLLVKVTNTSDRTIGFIRSPGLLPDEGFRYEIEVRNAQGELAPPSAYVQDLKNKTTTTFESRVARWLKPGESFVDGIGNEVLGFESAR
jgi:hypothetical protein